MDTETLDFGTNFWEDHLPGMSTASLHTKLHLLLSLLVYLSVTFQQLLVFSFSTEIQAVKSRASRFMGYSPSGMNGIKFAPLAIFNIWHERWPRSRQHLHDMIMPCAHEIVLAESDRIIKDPTLQVRLKDLTINGLHNLLHPDKLIMTYQTSAPLMFGLMQTFAASPNKYRKEKARKVPNPTPWTQEDENGDDFTDFGTDLDGGEDDERAHGKDWWKDFEGLSRNPVFAILLAISMLTFVRNRATNVLPVLLGLFFKISGTSSRVMLMLSNAGVCVSGRTVERLKVYISNDAIRLAVDLVLSGRIFVTIFDNINLFVRKFQQRMSNQNSMIHATNCAVIGLEDVEQVAENLQAKLDLRGKRASATVADILPTKEDDAHLLSAFEGLIAECIALYCPGSQDWEGRVEMLEAVREMIPTDRPLKATKSDVRPFGVFDVNEGSKKGIVEVLKAIQERSTLSEDAWSSKMRIIEGDWLTSNNLRGARRDRNDDVNAMERVEYPEELSALFHFALQSSHAIMRTHYGQAILNPSSLAAHKGLLNRTWDVNKPNYAAAKSLIRHSLIARILHCVMVINKFTLWSRLAEWRPTVDDIKAVACVIAKDFATTSAAAQAQEKGDDYMAHSIYFMRDALLFCEFEHAVSRADAGCVLRVLKYWSLSFRGAGQHNYARECAEVLIRWKYELSRSAQQALEKAWFVNRWGKEGRWIAADLYLEQLNFWVKRVFIAQGNGVTIEYIMEKGSACVEAFREVSHLVANFFGDPDLARKSKESSFQFDLKALVEEMVRLKFHVLAPNGHHVPAPPKKTRKKSSAPVAVTASDAEPRSAVFDVMVAGAEIWQTKFQEFLVSTTYDPALGYPLTSETVADAGSQDSRLDSGTAFDNTENPITYDDYQDMHGDEASGGLGAGSLGGGDEFSSGVDIF